MLYLKLYSSQQEIEEYLLTFLPGTESQLTCVVPSPVIADDVRELFSLKILNQMEVETFSKTLKEQLSKIKIQSNQNHGLCERNELMLKLGILWQYYFPNEPFQQFIKSFDLLTELRSVTVHYDVLDEIIQKLQSPQKEAIIVFWHYLTQHSIQDEAQALNSLSEFFRIPQHFSSEKNKDQQTYIFWSFTYFSAVQIDFLKSLSLVHNIIIFFPHDAYQKLDSSDWPNWLLDGKTQIVDAKTDQVNEKQPVQIIPFEKGALSSALLTCLSKSKGRAITLFTLSKDLSFNYLSELPINNLAFKISNQMFELSSNELFDHLQQKYFSYPSICYPYVEFLKKLNQELTEYLSLRPSNPQEIGHPHYYKNLKVLILLIEQIKKWNEINESQEKQLSISLFTFQLMRYMSHLRFPRNYTLPITKASKNQTNIAVYSLNDLGKYNPNHITLLCLSSSYNDFTQSTPNQLDTMRNDLYSIGPLRRNELNVEIIKSKINQIISKPNTFFVAQNDLVQEHPFWNGLLSENEFQFVDESLYKDLAKIETKSQPKYKILKQLNEIKASFSINRITPSLLQSYIDCPYKFYLTHIKRMYPPNTSPYTVTPRELGIIEHNLISSYLTLKDKRPTLEVEDVLDEIWTTYKEKNKISLKKFDENVWKTQIKENVQLVVSELIKLKALEDCTFSFEETIKVPVENDYSQLYSGRTDFVLRSQNKIGLLDFKRSSNSIPNISEFESFQNIQLWFYLYHLVKGPKDLMFLGFLNIDSIQDSLIYVGSENDRIKLEEGLGFLPGVKYRSFPQPLVELSTTFGQYLSQIVSTINSANRFPITPRAQKICRFCPITSVCPKKEENENDQTSA